MMQRFQLVTWPDFKDEPAYVDRKPDREALERVHRIYDRLANDLVQLDDTIDGEPRRFKFDSKAQSVFIKAIGKFEQWKRKLEDHPAMVQHLAKFDSLMPSLALLFHLADWAAGDDERPKRQVPASQAKRAFYVCRYLVYHARRVYSCVVSPQMSAMRSLADKIKAGKLQGTFSIGDVTRKRWSDLKGEKFVRNACEGLVSAGWLRRVELTSTGPGRPPGTCYEVNPKVLPKEPPKA